MNKGSIQKKKFSSIFSLPISFRCVLFGPSGVRALRLATGTNEGDHYLGTFFHFLLLLPPLLKTTEGVVVGFQIFAWAP